MRALLILCMLACSGTISVAQTITYDIPQAFEKDIRPEHYHFLVDAAAAVVAERYAIESVKGGTILLVKGQALAALNLDNLILQCVAVADTTRWPAIIRIMRPAMPSISGKIHRSWLATGAAPSRCPTKGS